MSRWFMNLPMLSDIHAVETAAANLGALRTGGYTADDGTHRANVEIDATVAALLDRAAIQVELRGCALEAIAESYANHS